MYPPPFRFLNTPVVASMMIDMMIDITIVVRRRAKKPRSLQRHLTVIPDRLTTVQDPTCQESLSLTEMHEHGVITYTQI